MVQKDYFFKVFKKFLLELKMTILLITIKMKIILILLLGFLLEKNGWIEMALC